MLKRGVWDGIWRNDCEFEEKFGDKRRLEWRGIERMFGRDV